MPSPKYPSDPDFNPFDLRPGTRNFPKLQGINKEGDPSSIPPNQIRDGINIRPDVDGYRARGGQTKGASTQASSDVDGLFDASDLGAAVAGEIILEELGVVGSLLQVCVAAGSERLYIIGGGNAINEAVPYYWDGATFDILGTPGDGEVHTILAVSGATCLVVGTAPYGGGPVAPELRTMSPSTGSTTALFQYGGTDGRIDNLCYLTMSEDGGVDGILLGSRAATGLGTKPGVLVTRDLSSVALERETDTAPGNDSQTHVSFSKHAVSGLVYVAMYDWPTSSNYGLFVRSAGGGLYTRIPIDTAAGQIDSGTYGGITANGVFVTNIPDDQGVRHVYIFGRSVVGTTLIGVYPEAANPTEVRLGFDSGPAGGAKGVHCAEDFNGLTYFGLGDDTNGAALASVTWIAGVQGWTYPIFSFSSNFPADAVDQVISLRAWAGSLYALCLDANAPNKAFLYKSDGTNVASWTKVGELVNAGLGAYSLNPGPQCHMVVF